MNLAILSTVQAMSIGRPSIPLISTAVHARSHFLSRHLRPFASLARRSPAAPPPRPPPAAAPPAAAPPAAPHTAAELRAAAAGLSPLGPDDLQTIERQLEQRSHPVAIGPRCRHGAPQAFVLDPLGRYLNQNHSGRVILESGLFRLSCPLLVKAIDEWEAKGAVVQLNSEIRSDARKMDELRRVHRDHASSRATLYAVRARALLDEREADEHSYGLREMLEVVLESGVAGQNVDKVDVKCLHAQVADGLCRSAEGTMAEANPIASDILGRLRASGVEVMGNAVCHEQCIACVPKEEAKFHYTSVKNKSKLRKTLRRRKEGREQDLLSSQGAHKEAKERIEPLNMEVS